MDEKQKIEAGWKRLEYIGTNPNTLTFRGSDGRRYRAGGDRYHKYVLIHPHDVGKMLNFSYFREAANITPKTVLEADARPQQQTRTTPPIVAKPVARPVRNARADTSSLDVTEMKVADVLELKLTANGWRQVLTQEKTQERPRKTVVRHAERRIRVAQSPV